MQPDRPSLLPARPFRILIILTCLLIAMMLVGFGYVASTLIEQNHASNQRTQAILHQLGESQNSSGTTGFESRKQNRCNAWVTQNALLQLLLLTPHLTPDQEALFRRLVLLPSLEVTNGDGTTTTLDCTRIIAQPVPGLPKPVPDPSP